MQYFEEAESMMQDPETTEKDFEENVEGNNFRPTKPDFWNGQNIPVVNDRNQSLEKSYSEVNQSGHMKSPKSSSKLFTFIVSYKFLNSSIGKYASTQKPKSLSKLSLSPENNAMAKMKEAYEEYRNSEHFRNSIKRSSSMYIPEQDQNENQSPLVSLDKI